MEDETFVKSSENFEFDLKWTANSMYSASIDTVSPPGIYGGSELNQNDFRCIADYHRCVALPPRYDGSPRGVEEGPEGDRRCCRTGQTPYLRGSCVSPLQWVPSMRYTRRPYL